MFGLDDWIASFSDGATLALVCLVAVVLGLRHATDPDHLAAVSTLIAGTRERATGAAAASGSPGASATRPPLFAFGLPIVLFQRYLPEPVQEAAETTRRARDRAARDLAAAALAPRCLPHARPPAAQRALAAAGVRDRARARDGRQRWRRRAAARLDPRPWLRNRGARAVRGSARRSRWRRSRPASASRSAAVAIGSVFPTLAPVLGLASLSFGVWYALGALQVAPYYL